MSPISNKIITTASCSFANPLIISFGVSIPNIPNVTTPIVKVNAGPIISLYKEIIINIRTNITIRP